MQAGAKELHPKPNVLRIRLGGLEEAALNRCLKQQDKLVKKQSGWVGLGRREETSPAWRGEREDSKGGKPHTAPQRQGNQQF